MSSVDETAQTMQVAATPMALEDAAAGSFDVDFRTVSVSAQKAPSTLTSAPAIIFDISAGTPGKTTTLFHETASG